MTEENQQEWQAPPPPENIVIEEEAPQMSEAATLGNIFFDAGRTFEDLRRKPRFILATLIMVVLITAFQFLFVQKMGDERMRRSIIEQMDKSSQMQSLPAEQRQQSIETSMKVTGFIRYLMPIFVLISFALGGLIYWLGAKAMGGSATFLGSLSVWVYSSFPPTVVSMIANIIILFLKSPDDIDIATSQGGLIQASPAFFINMKESPVLGAVLGTFDLFFIWGWILAAIGLCIVGKISKGAAWAIVLIVGLLNVAVRVIGALFS